MFIKQPLDRQEGIEIIIKHTENWHLLFIRVLILMEGTNNDSISYAYRINSKRL